MYGEKLNEQSNLLIIFAFTVVAGPFQSDYLQRRPYVFAPSPLAATTDNVEQALAFIKNSMLGGATDLRKALIKAVDVSAQFPAGEHSIVLISDANPTVGTRNLKQIIQALDKKSNGTSSVRVFAFGLGSDANGTLLEQLAETGRGYFARARETEDIATALKIFFDHVGSSSIENVSFSSTGARNFFKSIQAPITVLTVQASHTWDAIALLHRKRCVTMQAQFGPEPIKLSRDVVLPEFSDLHGHLPRVWARARGCAPARNGSQRRA